MHENSRYACIFNSNILKKLSVVAEEVLFGGVDDKAAVQY